MAYLMTVKAVCSDGVTRSVKVRSYWDGQRHCIHGDTYFSAPARVSVKGKTVAGYISADDNGYTFRAYLYRKNHSVIVATTANKS